MGILALVADGLALRVNTSGGAVTRLDWEGVPLLREAAADASGSAASAFPLVPFGNRVRNNRFGFEGRDCTLAPNTADPLALHGDGWLGEWTCVERSARSLTLAFAQGAAAHTPYRYAAQQRFALVGRALALTLSVTNRGADTLPFGLGWHPFFAQTPRTTLETAFAQAWTDAPGHLPGEPIAVPPDLDFRTPRPLPRRWLNNALDGWSGRARVVWPEHHSALRLEADPLFAHALLFAPDRVFDPSYDGTWFAFEPMTHRAGGHESPGAGFVALAPNETLSATLRLTPEPLAPDAP